MAIVFCPYYPEMFYKHT